MPAKVNPVIPEVVNQVCFKVIGNDSTITFAAEAGQLQLNVMEPVIGQAMFETISLLANACVNLRDNVLMVLPLTVKFAKIMYSIQSESSLTSIRLLVITTVILWVKSVLKQVKVYVKWY